MNQAVGHPFLDLDVGCGIYRPKLPWWTSVYRLGRKMWICPPALDNVYAIFLVSLSQIAFSKCRLKNGL
jgi:hypothetical protein